MKLEPECVGCIFNQMLNAFELLQPSISREDILKAQKKLMDYLLKFDIHANISPVLGKVAYNIISATINEDDPFQKLKIEYNQLALKYFKKIKKIIDKSKDPLFKAVVVSAIGNTIDFASQHKIDLISDIKNFNRKNFVINDYLELKQSLENSTHLLIIGDNAGEIVFDKLLVITIKRLYPEIEVFYSVRESPIINDATIEDAKSIGLTNLIKVIESSATPGVDIDASPEEFRKYFYQENGVILSKGQGNFESLYGIEVPHKDVFYLLKVKCTLMERIFRAKIGDLVLKKKKYGF